MPNLKTLTATGALILSSVTAHAALLDDDVDARESAEAVVHCADEAKGLFTTGSTREFLASVVGKHQKISAKIDTKRYTFQAASGGGMAPPVEGNTLYVDVKVTQPPDGSMDIPAGLEWSCSLQKR